MVACCCCKKKKSVTNVASEEDAQVAAIRAARSFGGIPPSRSNEGLVDVPATASTSTTARALPSDSVPRANDASGLYSAATDYGVPEEGKVLGGFGRANTDELPVSTAATATFGDGQIHSSACEEMHSCGSYATLADEAASRDAVAPQSPRPPFPHTVSAASTARPHEVDADNATMVSELRTNASVRDALASPETPYATKRSLRSKKFTRKHSLLSRSITDELDFASIGTTGNGSPAQIVHGLSEENFDEYRSALLMLAETPNWECAYESKSPPGKVLYQMDPGNRSGWIYFAMILPSPMVGVLAPTIEVETWTSWHPICTKHVRTGTCDKWKYQTRYEQSVCLGMFKTEQNTRVQSWVNETHGFFLQRVHSLQPGEDGYVPPRINRDNLEAVVLTMSPSPNETLMVYKLRIETPLAVPHFVQKFVFSTLAPKMLKQFVTNGSLLSNPKYPYKKLVEQDSTGIYAYLQKLVAPDAPKSAEILAAAQAFFRGEDMSTKPLFDESVLSRKEKKKLAKMVKQARKSEDATRRSTVAAAM